ncbi:hypothetical protein J6590_100001 [Homalodisca vitripennis]|nr:hypothetical protein J6590_100001 [Homalodisca vitripennis]
MHTDTQEVKGGTKIDDYIRVKNKKVPMRDNVLRDCLRSFLFVHAVARTYISHLTYWLHTKMNHREVFMEILEDEVPTRCGILGSLCAGTS